MTVQTRRCKAAMEHKRGSCALQVSRVHVGRSTHEQPRHLQLIVYSSSMQWSGVPKLTPPIPVEERVGMWRKGKRAVHARVKDQSRKGAHG